ncbi:hypothetical protein BUALT_Bualt18G0028300 [Buddleja alternifolia]|uniref:Uncharacterized protein n=1 Tax=Buddleja alternifolia TaxID=168488 RepID=A0AAV6W854_9LAMI|nr:hypothetical protein BUALT_Bualt18G0028300 [Buddleja alternifolia]
MINPVTRPRVSLGKRFFLPKTAMASSGTSGRPTNSGSKAFDFASDDILCSYEDYANQDGNNGTHSDPSIAPNSAKAILLSSTSLFFR